MVDDYFNDVTVNRNGGADETAKVAVAVNVPPETATKVGGVVCVLTTVTGKGNFL